MNRALLSLAILACTATAAAAQPLGATAHTDAVPVELAAPVKALLAAGGARVKVGAVTLDFWWVKGLPAKAAAAPSWAEVEESVLVGAVRVDATYRDVRGRTIKPGLYTLRFGIQPQNGDHLGVTPFREFLLLSPAASDKDPAPVGHDGVIDLSKETVGISHPAVLSMNPPVTKDAPLSTIKHAEENLEGIVFEVPLTVDGKPAGALRFALILVGKIDA
jgi:hypothetical protein